MAKRPDKQLYIPKHRRFAIDRDDNASRLNKNKLPGTKESSNAGSLKTENHKKSNGKKKNHSTSNKRESEEYGANIYNKSELKYFEEIKKKLQKNTIEKKSVKKDISQYKIKGNKNNISIFYKEVYSDRLSNEILKDVLRSFELLTKEKETSYPINNFSIDLSIQIMKKMFDRVKMERSVQFKTSCKKIHQEPCLMSFANSFVRKVFENSFDVLNSVHKYENKMKSQKYFAKYGNIVSSHESSPEVKCKKEFKFFFAHELESNINKDNSFLNKYSKINDTKVSKDNVFKEKNEFFEEELNGLAHTMKEEVKLKSYRMKHNSSFLEIPFSEIKTVVSEFQENSYSDITSISGCKLESKISEKFDRDIGRTEFNCKEGNIDMKELCVTNAVPVPYNSKKDSVRFGKNKSKWRSGKKSNTSLSKEFKTNHRSNKIQSTSKEKPNRETTEHEFISHNKTCPAKSDVVNALIDCASSMNDDNEIDDWENHFDAVGEPLDKNFKEEVSSLSGIKDPVFEHAQIIDYYNFQPRNIELDAGEFGHIVEIYDFSSSLKSKDIFSALTAAWIKDYHITWVDDAHALAVFSSQASAHTAMKQYIPIFKMRQLKNGTKQSKMKAKELKEVLLPYKKRPITTVSVARNLVTGALGLRSNATPEQRQKEREILKEARAKKQQKQQSKRNIWENPD